MVHWRECVLLLEYDLFGIPEWASWQNWSIALDVYSPERWKGVNALYVREQWECVDLYLGMNDERAENLSIRVRQQTNIDNIMVNVCSQSSRQEEKIKINSPENGEEADTH